MKRYAFYVCACLFSLQMSVAHAQNAKIDIPEAYTHSLDSLATYIDSRCDGDEQKLAALYDWITTHMHYNVYPTFVSVNEKRDEQKEILHTLQHREGVCRHFAKLFQAVGDRMGIPVFFIEGYTKANGVLMPDPHAWCAALVNGQWSLYDPTYGMGYIENYRFVEAPNSRYCRVAPEAFIADHMPFDPMWQLLPHPYTFQAFDKGGTPDSNRPEFAFADTLRAHMDLKPASQLEAINARIRRNGTPNPLVDYYVQLNTANIAVHRQNEVYDLYKNALKHYNRCVDLFNEVVRYQRSHKELKEEDCEIMRGWIANAVSAIAEAKLILRPATQVPEQYVVAVSNLKEAVMELAEKVRVKQEELS